MTIDANMKKAILYGLCEGEALASGISQEQIMNCIGPEIYQFGISGYDKAISSAIDALSDAEVNKLIQGDPIYAAVFMPHSDGPMKEFLRLAILNRCNCVAWGLGDATKLPFIQHESMNFRVSVVYGKQEEGLETHLGAGRLQIFLPESFGSGEVEQALALTRYAVVGSFMMHDESIKELMDKGDKIGAAAMAMASIGMTGRVIENIDSMNHDVGYFNDMKNDLNNQLENIAVSQEAATTDEATRPTVHLTTKTKGFAAANLKEELGSALQSVGYYFNEEAAGLTSYRDSAKTKIRAPVLSAVTRNAKNNWSGKVSEEEFESTVQGAKDIIANVVRTIDELKEKNPESGGGGGEQPDGGAGGAADQILRQIMSEQGEQAAQEEPGEASDSAGGEEGDEPSQGDRMRMLGRYGSTEQGRRMIELLSDRVQEKVDTQDSQFGWQDYLVGALLKSSGIDRVYNWARPNRRHIGNDIYLPGFRRRKVRRVAVMIDESGSINMQALEEFNAEFIRVIDIVNPEGVDIFHFSTQVAEETLSQGEAWEAKRLLNGGTNFRAAYDALAEHISNGQTYDAVIVFTDMEDSGYYGIKQANMLNHLPDGMDWYFVTFGGNCPKADFGVQVDITSGVIQEHG